jgi:hypothetical protein
LQRTLQTADLVFPDHCNIRVRDELRERLIDDLPIIALATFLAEEKFSNSFVHLRLNSFSASRPHAAAATAIVVPPPSPYEEGRKGRLW